GPPGPANLAALQGSPCTFNGHQSTLDVEVDSDTGVVTMTCKPVYVVSVSVSGGTMTRVDIFDDTNQGHDKAYNSVSTFCTTPAPSFTRRRGVAGSHGALTRVGVRLLVDGTQPGARHRHCDHPRRDQCSGRDDRSWGR